MNAHAPKDFAAPEPIDDHYRPEMAIVWMMFGIYGLGCFGIGVIIGKLFS
jgi:hypothetical protein